MSTLARQNPELLDQWVTEANQDHYAYEEWKFLRQREELSALSDIDDVLRRNKPHTTTNKKTITVEGI